MVGRKISRSFRCEGYNDVEQLGHNNRTFVAKNVDKERIKDNITYLKENLEKVYSELFGEALKKYNASKTKTRDKIPNYYEHIKNGKQEKLFCEVIVQFGDKDSCAVGSENGKLAVKMLDEYMKDFQKRNPHLRVFNAVMHLDEATPHLHINFIPFATNQKRGLETRVSFKTALQQQGFMPETIALNESAKWCESERSVMEELAKKYDLKIENKFAHHQHVSVEEYKNEKDKLEKLKEHTKKLTERTNGVSAADITDYELDLLRNENEYVKTELTKKEKQVRELSEKLSSGFAFFQIPDDQKLLFVADKMIQSNIPVVEDTHGIHVPVYAIAKMKEIAKTYKPKLLSYRQRLKLTIDRLVYAVNSTSELFYELRKRGYTVRVGKYISIRPEGSDRGIRTKTLGDDYVLEALERRIQNKRNFENNFKARYEEASQKNPMLHEYYSVTETTIAMIYSAEKYPAKLNAGKSYTMSNDKHINELVSAMSLISYDRITSIADVESRIEAYQHSLDDMSGNLDKLNRIQIAIKDVIKAGEIFFAERQAHNYTEQENVRAAEIILKRNGITNAAEIEKLKLQYAENKKAITILNDKIPKTQAKQSEYLRLKDIYELVHSGSYIDRLIKEHFEKEKENEKLKENENTKRS